MSKEVGTSYKIARISAEVFSFRAKIGTIRPHVLWHSVLSTSLLDRTNPSTKNEDAVFADVKSYVVRVKVDFVPFHKPRYPQKNAFTSWTIFAQTKQVKVINLATFAKPSYKTKETGILTDKKTSLLGLLSAEKQVVRVFVRSGNLLH